MEDEEKEAWPALLSLVVCTEQSTQSKEKITHYVECCFLAGLCGVNNDVYKQTCWFE